MTGARNVRGTRLNSHLSVTRSRDCMLQFAPWRVNGMQQASGADILLGGLVLLRKFEP